jgi:DNA-binding MarR family transcriptional regulator
MPDDAVTQGSAGASVPINFIAYREFRRALTVYLTASASLVRGAGLTERQFACLVALGGEAGGEMSVGELAAELGLTHHAAVELSQRAEAAGLLERHPDPGSGRRTLLRLSARGLDCLEQLTAEHIDRLGDARAVLVATLSRWNEALEKTRRHAG